MRGNYAAEQLISRILEEGFQYPFYMSDICQYLGVLLRFCDLGSIDGCYMRNTSNGRKIILINNKVSATRQRFSIAHEIGHIELNHPPIAFLGGSYAKRQETEANHFAAEFLMPKVLLMKNGSIIPEEISKFSWVSLEAARVRVEQLGWI